MQGLGRRGDLTIFTEEIPCQKDRVLDLFVACTAAKITFDRLFDGRAGGVEVLVQQRFRRDDHPGDAKAALYRAGLCETMFINAHFIGIYPLDGQHLFALQFRQGHNARLGLFTVDQHGTGTAYALGAAVFRGGEVQIVPKKAQQLFVVGRFIIPAVDIDDKHRIT